MKFTNSAKKIIIMIYSSIILLAGCVNPVDTPPPDNTAPVLKIFSPLSNDTVYIGQTPINYAASDDNGISRYEIYVNDTLTSTFKQPPDSANVGIFLNTRLSELNKKINYYVVVYDLSGNKTTGNLISNILVNQLNLPPAAPSNLTLNKISDKIYNLTWRDESDNELNFELWRKQDTSEFKLIRILPKNSVSTNDTIPFPDLAYSYIIKASNKNGKSESNIVSTTPDASALINAPTNLNAAAYGTSRVKLIWKDNSNNELAFKIERKVSSSNTYEQLGLANANDTIYYDTTNLFPTTEYTYRVAAIGEFGASDWSNSATVTTLSHDVNPPDNFQATYDSTRKAVVLSWKNNGIFNIETKIERSGTDKKFTEIGVAGENSTNYYDSTVSQGKTYFYRIRSHTVDGYDSEYTEEIEVKL